MDQETPDKIEQMLEEVVSFLLQPSFNSNPLNEVFQS